MRQLFRLLALCAVFSLCGTIAHAQDESPVPAVHADSDAAQLQAPVIVSQGEHSALVQSVGVHVGEAVIVASSFRQHVGEPCADIKLRQRGVSPLSAWRSVHLARSERSLPS